VQLLFHAKEAVAINNHHNLRLVKAEAKWKSKIWPPSLHPLKITLIACQTAGRTQSGRPDEFEKKSPKMCIAQTPFLSK
jgi:hypothetical protein